MQVAKWTGLYPRKVKFIAGQVSNFPSPSRSSHVRNISQLCSVAVRLARALAYHAPVPYQIHTDLLKPLAPVTTSLPSFGCWRGWRNAGNSTAGCTIRCAKGVWGATSNDQGQINTLELSDSSWLHSYLLFCSSSKLGEISKLSRSVRMTTGLSIRQFHWVNPFNVRVFHQQRVLPLHWPMGPKQSSFLSDFRPEVTDFCPEVIPCSSGRTLKTCYYDCLSDSLALARACVCVRACVRVVLERILTLDNRNTKLL